MEKPTDSDWQEIRNAVENLTASSVGSRVDLKLGNLKVLVYWAGSVLRIDFKPYVK